MKSIRNLDVILRYCRHYFWHFHGEYIRIIKHECLIPNAYTLLLVFSTMESNNIHDLINLSNKLKFLIGTTKVGINRGKIHKMATIYRFYALFLGSFVFCVTLYSLCKLAPNLNRTLPPLLIFVVVMKNITLILAYLFIIYNGCFKTSKFIKTYIEISKVCKMLKSYDKKYRSHFNLYYLVFLTIKTCYLVYELKLWTPKVKFGIITYNLVMATVEIEIINYILEMNEVSKCFELLNWHLKILKPERDMEIQDNIIINAWKSNHFKNIEKISFKQLMIVYNRLIAVVNDHRSLHGLMVRFIFKKSAFWKMYCYCKLTNLLICSLCWSWWLYFSKLLVFVVFCTHMVLQKNKKFYSNYYT